MTPLLEAALAADPEATDARALAAERHAKQVYDDRPYVEAHLDLVAQLTLEAGLPREYLVAAYLHDLLEDCSDTTTEEELRSRFNADSVDWTVAVSGFGPNRKAQRDLVIENLRRRPEAIRLKLCDRTANAMACRRQGLVKFVQMYADEMPAYGPLFSAADRAGYERLCQILGTKPL